jgi:hypothetical protein
MIRASVESPGVAPDKLGDDVCRATQGPGKNSQRTGIPVCAVDGCRHCLTSVAISGLLNKCPRYKTFDGSFREVLKDPDDGEELVSTPEQLAGISLELRGSVVKREGRPGRVSQNARRWRNFN